MDGAAGFTSGSSVTVSGEGVHTLAYRSTDAVGNVEAEKSATVRIDTSAPVTSDDAPSGWSSGAVLVALTATDGGSGVTRTEYKLDGATTFTVGTVVAVAAPSDHSNDGVHTIVYRSIDAVGNVEAEKTARVRIDTTAPVTSDDAPAGWSNGPVTVTLSATDTGSGVATTEYRVNGAAAWTAGTTVTIAAPADHSNDGAHTITYRSTDSLGHVEAEKTATVRIDTTAPVTSDDAPTGWSNGPVTVTLSATDGGGSGLATTEYKLDGATAWSTGTSVPVSGQGIHTLNYRSTDAAGNTEAEKTTTVRIDTTAPVTSDDAPTGWSNSPVTVTLSATDSGGSGLATTEYKLDGATALEHRHQRRRLRSGHAHAHLPLDGRRRQHRSREDHHGADRHDRARHQRRRNRRMERNRGHGHAERHRHRRLRLGHNPVQTRRRQLDHWHQRRRFRPRCAHARLPLQRRRRQHRSRQDHHGADRHDRAGHQRQRAHRLEQQHLSPSP